MGVPSRTLRSDSLLSASRRRGVPAGRQSRRDHASPPKSITSALPPTTSSCVSAFARSSYLSLVPCRLSLLLLVACRLVLARPGQCARRAGGAPLEVVGELGVEAAGVVEAAEQPGAVALENVGAEDGLKMRGEGEGHFRAVQHVRLGKSRDDEELRLDFLVEEIT